MAWNGLGPKNGDARKRTNLQEKQRRTPKPLRTKPKPRNLGTHLKTRNLEEHPNHETQTETHEDRKKRTREAATAKEAAAIETLILVLDSLWVFERFSCLEKKSAIPKSKPHEPIKVLPFPPEFSTHAFLLFHSLSLSLSLSSVNPKPWPKKQTQP